MTKKILMALLLWAVSVTTIYAQGIHFEDITLEKAMKLAEKGKDGKKLIFLDCYTAWCGPCKRMAQNVFTLKAYGDYFNANLINLKKDMQSEEGKEIAQKYKVYMFPTFLILNERGEEVNRIVGARSAEDFLRYVWEATQPGCSLQELTQAYEASPGNVEIGMKLAAMQSCANKDASKVISEVYANASDETKYTDRFYRLLFSAVSPEDSLLDDVMVHYTRAARVIGKDRLQMYMGDFCVYYLLDAVRDLKEHKTADMERAAAMLGMLGFETSDPLAYVGEIVLAYHKGDHDAMIACVEQNFDRLAPSPMKSRLEGLMGMGQTPEQKARVQKYYQTQAVNLEKAFLQYKNMAEKSGK